MANDALGAAKRAKNDEFYTQYHDIEKEMNSYLDFNPDVFRGKTVLLPCDDPEWSNFTKYFAQNFERLGLQKLVSTSYAPDSKPEIINYQPTLFETEDPKFDSAKTRSNGKIFTLLGDTDLNQKIDVEDLQWDYLDGDGDFRSDEITRLRDEADLIITNPPFSLFRDFVQWLVDSKNDFVILGNKNSITYKEIFPLIRSNKIWLGATPISVDLLFGVPEAIARDFEENGREGSNYKVVDGKIMGRASAVWFSTLDHGRRHQPLQLMTLEENRRFSKHKDILEKGYPKYDNYDAIEVGFTDAIPSDYEGVMGVPISFLGKYSPEQFEILGMAASSYDPFMVGIPFKGDKDGRPLVDGKNTYARIMIRHKKE